MTSSTPAATRVSTAPSIKVFPLNGNRSLLWSPIRVDIPAAGTIAEFMVGSVPSAPGYGSLVTGGFTSRAWLPGCPRAARGFSGCLPPQGSQCTAVLLSFLELAAGNSPFLPAGSAKLPFWPAALSLASRQPVASDLRFPTHH